MDKSICIVDLAGAKPEWNYWADWYPEYSAVKFGGYWAPIPNWAGVTLEPTEQQVYKYAEIYEDLCSHVLKEYLHSAFNRDDKNDFDMEQSIMRYNTLQSN